MGDASEESKTAEAAAAAPAAVPAGASAAAPSSSSAAASSSSSSPGPPGAATASSGGASGSSANAKSTCVCGVIPSPCVFVCCVASRVCVVWAGSVCECGLLMLVCGEPDFLALCVLLVCSVGCGYCGARFRCRFSRFSTYLPKYFSSEWSFAKCKGPDGVRTICCFGAEPNTVIRTSRPRVWCGCGRVLSPWCVVPHSGVAHVHSSHRRGWLVLQVRNRCLRRRCKAHRVRPVCRRGQWKALRRWCMIQPPCVRFP